MGMVRWAQKNQNRITMTETETLTHIEEALKKLNGVNVIVENEHGGILTGRSTYGEKKLMLPGGAIERGELSKHAATSETEEETGIVIQEEDLRLVGTFVQRLRGIQSASGFLFLYYCSKFVKEEHVTISGPELEDIRFRSVEEILEKRDDFGLGYIRMIIAFLRVKDKLDKSPMERRLSDKIDYVYKGKLISV